MARIPSSVRGLRASPARDRCSKIGAIAALKAEERAELAAYYHALWHETDGLLQPASVRAVRTEEFFAREIAKARTRPLIARDGKGIAGMVLWQGAFVQALYVRADHRGCGLGARLLARAEERIGKSDALKVALMCVAGNDRARTFYERHGYRQTMTRNVKMPAGGGLVLVQAWRMEKRLKGTPAAARSGRKA